jgi:FkbM family methyltransferase
MNFKLQVGWFLQKRTDDLIRFNYRFVPFIPNGRILPLDLKRANIYPRVIFDIGANIGQTANYLIKNFPDADIYCFEPVKKTYEELLSNIHNNNIHPINEGLGIHILNQSIHKNDLNEHASLKENDGRFSEIETVKINTGENFCNQNQINSIDLLKIDTEGYELEVLKGFGIMLRSNVKMIYAEVGFDRSDIYKTFISDLIDFSNDNGFITSGFYEHYRWGNTKLRFFCNILLTNTNLIAI